MFIFKSYSILTCSDNLDSLETRILYWPGQIAALRETGQRAKPQSLEPFGLLPTLSPSSTNEKAVWDACVLLAQEWCQSREFDLAGCSWLEPSPFLTQFGVRTHCCASMWRCRPCLPHIHSLLLLSSFTSWFPLASGLPCLTAAWTLGLKN